MELKHFLTSNEDLIIYQDNELNPFSMDSVLLADFVRVTKKHKKAIDFCTGNAPIAMLIAAKHKQLKFEAIEIQEPIYNLGLKSIIENKMEDQVNIMLADLKGISDTLVKNTYDIITCNPPYFKVDEDSNINERPELAIARHELLVNLDDIFKESKKLLSNVGVLYLVYRPQRLQDLIACCNKYGFNIRTLQFIHPKRHKNANTILVEIKKNNNNAMMNVLPPLYIYNDDNKYTPEASKIINGEK